MGTRSLTRFHDDDPNATVLCGLYRQFDGYLSGMGKDLVTILKNTVEVNGLGSNKHKKDIFNGPGELPLFILWKLKQLESVEHMSLAEGLKKVGDHKPISWDMYHYSGTFPNGGYYLVPYTCWFRVGTQESDAGQEYEYDIFPQGEGKTPLITCTRVYDGLVLWDKRDPCLIRSYAEKD